MLVCVVILRSVITALGILVIGACFGAVAHRQSSAEFLFWVIAVSMIFGLLGIIVGAVGEEFRAAQHAHRLLHRAAVDGRRRVQHDRHAAALAALARLRQSVLLFHQRPAPRDDRLQRRPADGRRRADLGPGRRARPGNAGGSTRSATACGSRRPRRDLARARRASRIPSRSAPSGNRGRISGGGGAPAGRPSSRSACRPNAPAR